LNGLLCGGLWQIKFNTSVKNLQRWQEICNFMNATQGNKSGRVYYDRNSKNAVRVLKKFIYFYIQALFKK
jgi:hypothetical protein